MLTVDEIDLAALSRSVVCQALEDATTWNRKGRGNGAQSWHDVEEAILFLTATHGEWAESREIVCGNAGIDPVELRLRSLKALKNNEVWRRSDYSGGAVFQESGD